MMLFSAVCNQLSSRNNLDRSKVIQSESGTIWSWRYIAHIYMLTHYLISSCKVPLYIDYNLIIGFIYLLCSCNNGSFKVLAPPSIYGWFSVFILYEINVQILYSLRAILISHEDSYVFSEIYSCTEWTRWTCTIYFLARRIL